MGPRPIRHGAPQSRIQRAVDTIVDTTQDSFGRTRKSPRSGAFRPLFYSAVRLSELTEDLVWRLYRPLFLLPDRIYTRPYLPLSTRGPVLFLWHTIFCHLFNAPIHMVRCVCRMVASSRTHPFRSMVHSWIFSCGEAKGRLHSWSPLVDERSQKDGEHTRHITVRHRPLRCFNRRVHPGGIRDYAIQGSWPSHCSKSSRAGPRSEF